MRLPRFHVVLLMLLCAGLVQADEQQIRERLEQLDPPLNIVSVVPAAAGLFEVRLQDGSILHTSSDGRYLVVGDLYEVSDERVVNLTEAGRSGERAERLASVAEDAMIRFAPQGSVRDVIYVFTDVTCGFCQRLHLDVPELNEAGVEVRYLAYPRAGVGSDSYREHVSAWCADDRQRAITQLKAREQVRSRDCTNPVADQYALGQELGIRGTPAIFTSEGQLIPGYRPPADLLAEIGLD